MSSYEHDVERACIAYVKRLDAPRTFDEYVSPTRQLWQRYEEEVRLVFAAIGYGPESVIVPRVILEELASRLAKVEQTYGRQQPDESMLVRVGHIHSLVAALQSPEPPDEPAPLSGNLVRKGGHNPDTSQIKTRPDAPASMQGKSNG